MPSAALSEKDPSTSVIVRDDAGRVLLARHSEGNVWVTPGGAIEPLETPADAAVRKRHDEVETDTGGWVLRETATAALTRAALRKAVDDEFTKIGEPAVYEPSEFQQKLGVEWRGASTTERVQALSTTSPGEAARAAACSEAAPALLAAAVGATNNRDEDGNWLPTYEMARSFCLLAAAASEVAAFDTVFTDFKNSEGLRRYASNARRDGFSGMLAIHPEQVDLINEAFVPTAEEIQHAARIVELFEEDPEMGTIGMDGKMVDRPHYVQALRLLKLARISKS